MNTKELLITGAERETGPAHARTVERIISNHPFLEDMSPHQLRLLSDCAIPEHFGANEIIFREGDPANRFYLLQKGQVALESYVPDKGRVCVETIGAGEVLGWSWLFPPYLWHFDARAIEPTDAVFIYGIPLRDECELDHELGYELTKRMAAVMMRRLQRSRRQLLENPICLSPNNRT
ncbi:MAG: Crp/Fnr family transcriptional regulator [Verrucomicrobia bacterium]|nr:MAG: Crp/Fnr family transcriptional regulator [Verrucomicrobiota bacterium]